MAPEFGCQDDDTLDVGKEFSNEAFQAEQIPASPSLSEVAGGSETGEDPFMDLYRRAVEKLSVEWPAPPPVQKSLCFGGFYLSPVQIDKKARGYSISFPVAPDTEAPDVEQRKFSITVHILGHLNVGADMLSRGGLQVREWRLYPRIETQIWDRFGKAQVETHTACCFSRLQTGALCWVWTLCRMYGP